MTNTTVVDVQQTEVGGKRFYKVVFDDGGYRLLRSVTTITKGARLPSFLDEWERDQIEQIGVQGYRDALNQKALDGTIVHKAIEMHLGGEEISRTAIIKLDDGKEYVFDDDTWPMFEAYLEWEEKRKPELIWTEKTLYSLRYGYAGRSDGLMLIDGKSTIIDFKSSKSVQAEHKQQGCAYFMAANEMGEECEQVLILCLGQKPGRKQGFSESIISNPYEIHNHFMGFYHKNQLVNWDSPILV